MGITKTYHIYCDWCDVNLSINSEKELPKGWGCISCVVSAGPNQTVEGLIAGFGTSDFICSQCVTALKTFLKTRIRDLT